MDSFPLVNRCAVLVTPKSPFWEWVNRTSNELKDHLFDGTGTDPNIYLVPDYESEPEMDQAIKVFVEKNYQDIFISELEGWNTDPIHFPQISYKRFEEWFSISYYTMIFDMVKRPLKRE